MGCSHHRKDGKPIVLNEKVLLLLENIWHETTQGLWGFDGGAFVH